MLDSKSNAIKISFAIHAKHFDMEYRFKDGLGDYFPEAELALRLLPAMSQSTPIELPGKAIDGLFLNSLIDIQHIYHFWNDRYKVIPIQGTVGIDADPSAQRTGPKRVATFFSGGVDSFYTLIKHQPEITDIIFVHGLDIPLENIQLRQQTVTALKDIAKVFNIRLLEVETNMKSQLLPYAEWGTILHGVALSSVGLLLQKEFSKIFIPSSHDYANLFPWGTHPLLDHLWSTSRLQFIHDGAEATRLQKVQLISSSETALQHLRVCWRNTNGDYNCGKCEKCLRTMINLYVCGKLDKCKTFPEPLNIKRVARMKLKGKNTRNFARENISMLQELSNGAALHQPLQRALKTALRRSLFKKMIKKSYK